MPLREIAALDRALARAGETVVVSRGAISVACRAMVIGLSATTVRPGSSSTVGNYRAILSPTALLAASPAYPLPIRTNDQILVRGVSRAVTFANNIQIGSTYVRIELDLVG